MDDIDSILDLIIKYGGIEWVPMEEAGAENQEAAAA